MSEMITLDDAFVVEKMRTLLELPIHSSISIQRSSRRYSTTWIVNVTIGGQLYGSYFAKYAGAHARRQARLSARADSIFRNHPLHVSSCVRCEANIGLLVSPIFSGRSLGALMANGATSHPFQWYRDLTSTLEMAGTWLKRYHHRGYTGSVSEPLVRYLERRKQKLDQLPSTSRRKLLRLVESSIVDNLVVTHSDYSPGNILSNGRALCVIDYGISEWIDMSPWWDVLTLLTLVERFFLFHKLTPHYWCRPLLSSSKNIFLSAYGRLPPSDSLSFRACSAVRHFSLAQGFTIDALKMDARSRWHAERLESLLDKM